MQFINPLALWGLLLLIFPIIFHLFYFRRYKEVKFTNVKFLTELKEEKSVRDRLRQLLILLMRLAALAFLVLAFARPFLPGKNQENRGKKSVSIYLDNSYSMQAFGDEIAHLDNAKRLAEKIIKTYDIEDEFQIIRNDFDYNDQRWISGDAAIDVVREVELSPVSRSLNDIIHRQKQISYDRNQKNKFFYIISDFQRPILPVSLEIDTSIDVNLIYVKSSKQPNLSIDSIWTHSPVFEFNQINPLYVQVSNYGDADIRDAGLSLKYDGQVKPLGVLEVGAGQTKTDTFNIVPKKSGWQQAEITVKDYPVAFDNSYYIAFDVPQKLRMLALYGDAPSSRLSSILSGINSIDARIQAVTQVDYGQLPSYDLVILHNISTLSTGISQALTNYIQNGGKVLLFPQMNQSTINYDRLINAVGGMTYSGLVKEDREVYTVNEEAYVFSSVFEPTTQRIALPAVSEYYTMDHQRQFSLPLMSFRDGKPYVSQVKSGRGFFYQFATDLSESSSSLLATTDIFIPMIYRMALQRNVEAELSYTIGKETIISINHPSDAPVDEPIRIKGEIEFIPGQQTQGQAYILDMHNEVNKSGVYDVAFRDSTIRKIAFNYDRQESDLRQPSINELKELYSEVTVIDGVHTAAVENFIKSASLGKELWRWCLILVLIFLALEQIFVRYLSKG